VILKKTFRGVPPQIRAASSKLGSIEASPFETEVTMIGKKALQVTNTNPPKV
jgi:hypothetical protein